MAGTASHDQVETATEFCPSYFEGAYNPLIRRHFLGVFRFAQMALADVRTLTHAQGIKSYTKSTPIIEMAGTSQMASATGDRYTPTGSLNATKRRLCLRMTKPCLGTWKAKT